MDESLAEQARSLGVNISAAAREGVQMAVCKATVRRDREAYQAFPEEVDPFWDEAEAWSAE
jgi:post-segregation antitoxin (ccd killing protein)